MVVRSIMLLVLVEIKEKVQAKLLFTAELLKLEPVAMVPLLVEETMAVEESSIFGVAVWML